MKKLLVFAALSAFLGACQKPEEPSKEMSTPDVPSAKEQEAAPTVEEAPEQDLAPEEPTTKLGELPVSGDLEEEADKTVVASNLEAELERIEAELED